MVKLNNGDNYEHLLNVRLTENKFPIAYKAKLNELIENGLSEEEAREYLDNSTIELELYYSPNNGLFAVETDAIECGATIYDPYTSQKCKEWYEN